MRLAWQMRELSLRKMLRKLGRDEFNFWWVAYHELHLDGALNAARVSATIHNELAFVNARLGHDVRWHKPEDELPGTVFGDEPDPVDEPLDDTDWEAAAAAAWG